MFDGIINAFKAFIPKWIGLIVAMLVARLIYEAVINEQGFQAMGLVETLATTVVASLFTVLTVAALDSYNSAE